MAERCLHFARKAAYFVFLPLTEMHLCCSLVFQFGFEPLGRYSTYERERKTQDGRLVLVWEEYTCLCMT